MREIILTSKSPRRKDILKERGYEFHIFPIEVSEILDKNLNLTEQISECAQRKVRAALLDSNILKLKDKILVGADTVVVFAEKILGKPKKKQEAIEILSQLSGQVHEVITGFCLYDLTSRRFILGHDITKVKFRELHLNEIKDYVATGDCMDKAGAYGIQGEARKFVESFEGSLNNVIGLPIEEIERVFQKEGWVVRKKSQ